MTNIASSSVLMTRAITGFVFAPLIASLVYTVYESGLENVFPLYLFVLFDTTLVTLFVLLPGYMVLSRKNMVNLLSVTLFVFVALFVVSLLAGYWQRRSFTSLSIGPDVFVSDGAITKAGYVDLLHSSLVIAVFAAVGAVIFYIIARYKFKK